MKFGPTPLAEVQDAILAHSLRLAGGTLKKGRVLSADDVKRLRDAGIESVVAARLERGDVHEDEAASTLARALMGVAAHGVRIGAPFTGRSNLYATRTGLLDVDRSAIDAANSVHESITVATLPAGAIVHEKQMLATVKIIPFAVTRKHLDGAVQTLGSSAQGNPGGVRVAAFNGFRAALIQTRLPGMRESVLDKTVRVVEGRLAPIRGQLVSEDRCEHDAPAIAACLKSAIDAGAELVMIAGASAIVDRRDVVPAAVEQAGGTIEHYGMPVDPGNLLLLARHRGVPVLGLPGCARSPKFNGFDQVLERLAAGLDVSPAYITGLGAGGLLKEIPDRPQPRSQPTAGAGAVSARASVPARAPTVAAVVLAGGQSRRMGSINKLLAEVGGKPMVVRAVEAAQAAGVDWIVVVTGHEHERVREVLRAAAADPIIRFAHNPDFAEGLSASLVAGLAELPEETEAALILLGDMPAVDAVPLERLMAAYDPEEGRSICVPTFSGKRGNPVLWDRRFFEEMRTLKGDVGAKHLIGEHADLVCEVEMANDAVLLDVDSPSQMAAVADTEGEP